MKNKMEIREVRKHIKKMMTSFKTDSLSYQVLDEAQKFIKESINAEYGDKNNSSEDILIESFPGVIFKTYPGNDEGTIWYTIRCEFNGAVCGGYIYKLSRKEIMSKTEQYIMVKLKRHPTEDELVKMWEVATKR